MKERIQKKCKHHGLTNHYYDKSNNHWSCIRCRSKAVAKYRKKIRATLVENYGGYCELCGYNKCIRALQFHHVDPSKKCFGISQKGLTYAKKKYIEEAAKCVLLCANCHAEVEEGMTELSEHLIKRATNH